jgi:hypothetical protein
MLYAIAWKFQPHILLADKLELTEEKGSDACLFYVCAFSYFSSDRF